MTRKLSLAVALAASLLVAACEGGESGTITVNLLHEDCLEQDVFGSAQKIEVTVRGPGLDGQPIYGDIAAKQLDVAEIPAGKDREVTVRAVACAVANGNGSGGCDVATVFAVGHSKKFDVVADQDQVIDVQMVGVNRVHYTATPDNQCTTASTRAGHSVAAFKDGRALLVGGFVVDEETEDPEDVRYLDTVELYEPATGAFRTLDPIPAICGPNGDQTCERAFAPAVVQENNGKERLLVIGGEYQDAATGALLARGEILVFDPTVEGAEAWSTIKLQKARRHHTATLLNNGSVMIVGGFGNPGEGEPVPVVAEVETLDAKGSNTSVKGSFPRALHGAAADGKDGVVIAGGVTESVVTEQTAFPLEVVRLAVSSTLQKQNRGTLPEGAIGPSVFVKYLGTGGGGGYVVVAGGVEPDHGGLPQGRDVSRVLTEIPTKVGPEGKPLGGQVFPFGNVAESVPVPARPYPLKTDWAFGCGVALDDSRFLVAGGVSAQGDVVTPVSTASVQVLTWVDKSGCKPTECEADTQCAAGTTCVANACRLACTEDAECGSKGRCLSGYCTTDLSNPDHRCPSGADLGCYAGSTCALDGEFAAAYINGSTYRSSGLLEDRAWATCAKLSDDQILITGGLSSSVQNMTLGSAEIYEITHAGR
jgi:hypothetical protein